MTYYVWTRDGDCQDKSEDLAEACLWALDLIDKGAYIADEKHRVHRAAWEPAVKDTSTPLAKKLAESLACYVLGADDITLTREQFLRLVVDRIEDDLRDRTF